MSTVAEVHAQPGHGPANLTAFVDRWIFVFMAAFLLAAALAGFIPDSLEKVAAVESGRRPPLPPVMHMHAVLMGTWLTLLLAQTTLMATGQARYHRQLGMASLVLAPAIVLTGIVLIPTMHAERWAASTLLHRNLPRSSPLVSSSPLTSCSFRLAPGSCSAPSSGSRCARGVPTLDSTSG